GPQAPGRLLGVQVAVADPAATAGRWAQVLGVPADGPRLDYAGGAVEFSPADADAVAAVRVALPAAIRGDRPGERIGGVHFAFDDEEPR
ncbi:MAG: hypothetical protein JWM71_1964, partial [Solirubrobacteraceae bacterium]|nr:hypothetical protein [Solirubrobacteraceae bacterium]